MTGTKEVNVSPAYQCRKSHLERKVSFEFEKALNFPSIFSNQLEDKEYLDPIIFIASVKEKNLGYYKP